MKVKEMFQVEYEARKKRFKGVKMSSWGGYQRIAVFQEEWNYYLARGVSSKSETLLQGWRKLRNRLDADSAMTQVK